MKETRTKIICMVLIMAILAVYWQVVGCGFINLDDNHYIIENYHVKQGLNLKAIKWAFTTMYFSNWHPLTWLSYMLDYQLSGMHAGMYHVENVIFHILNTLLLFLVLNRMTKATWKSAFVAALFALHPIHVESVAWISERKDVLSTFFGLLTIWAYVRYIGHKSIKTYILTLSFFSLGLMAKPMLVTLPFVMLLLDYWPLGRINIDKTNELAQKDRPSPIVLEKIPFLIMAIASSIITFIAQKSGGSVATFTMVPFHVRIENALISYISYIYKMVWPYHLAVPYPYPKVIPIWQVTEAVLILSGISILAVTAMRRHPYLLVGWLWYLGTLVPVIGVVQVGSQAMADRYTYIPLIGIFVMISWGIPELLNKWQYKKQTLSITAGVALTILMIITYIQLGYWKNSIILFKHTLEITPDNTGALLNLGQALYKKGSVDEAIKYYLKSLEINPMSAMACCNLAVALRAKGKLDEADKYYLKALEINPRYIEAYYNLGNLLDSQGKVDRAIYYYRKASQLDPENVDIHYNLAIALEKAGRIEDAIREYSKALRLSPDSPDIHINLGLTLASQGKIEAAIRHYKKALSIKHDSLEAHLDLGVALTKLGRLDEAIRHYLDALKIDPNCIEAHNDLGIALLGKGKIDKAIRHFKEVLRIRPNDAEAKKNLEIARKSKERTVKLNQAITKLKDMLKVEPRNPALHIKLGDLYRVKGEIDNAIEQYKNALSIEPRSIEVFNKMAIAYASRGEYNLALSSLKEIIEFRPDNAAGYYNIACIYARQNKKDEAISWLKKAIDRGFNNWVLIRTDPDLENIRRTSYYKELVERVGKE